MRRSLRLGKRGTDAHSHQANRDAWLLLRMAFVACCYVAFPCSQAEDILMFDATARDGIASPTEKRERPRLPMVSFDVSGGVDRTMKDAYLR